MKAFVTILFLLSIAFLKSNADPLKWVQTNGPFGGNIKMLVPNSKGDIFALSEDGQLFKCAKGNDTWEAYGKNYDWITPDSKDNLIVAEKNGDILQFDRNMNLIKIVQKGDQQIERKFVVTNKDYIYVFAQNIGLSYTSTGGENWEQIIDINPYKLIFDSSGTAFLFTLYENPILRFDSNHKVIDTVMINPEDNLLFVKDIEYNFKFNHWIAVCNDESIYISTNAGTTWGRSPSDIKIHNLFSIHVTKSGKTFINNYEDTYMSTDGGFNWSRLNGLNNLLLTSIIEHEGNLKFSDKSGVTQYNLETEATKKFNNGLIAFPISKIAIDKDGIVFIAASYWLFRSTDEGANWDIINLPFATMSSSSFCDHIFCSNAGILFISTCNDSWMSSDKGDTWKSIRYKHDMLDKVVQVAAQDKSGRYYGMGGTLYYSDDETKTWHTSLSENIYLGVTSVATWGDCVAFGSLQNGIYYSADRGTTIYELPLDVPNNYGSNCLFNSKGDTFVVMNSSNGNDIVFRSSDGCKTFKNLLEISDVQAFISIDSSDYLYTRRRVNGVGGLIRSTDNGDTWEEASDTSDARLSVTDICFGTKNDAYMGTAYNGVFRCDKVKSAREPRIANRAKLLISPNPAAERATITVSENIGPTEITIYNQLGAAVFKRKLNGEGELEIYTSEFPQGAYFVKVSAGEEVLTGKFAVVK